MRRPTWLHELRDLLVLRTADERQRALTVWEARWVLDVHAVRLVIEPDRGGGYQNLVAYLGVQVQRELGCELGRLMVTLNVEDRPFLAPAKVVHGGAWAIRREPKTDD